MRILLLLIICLPFGLEAQYYDDARSEASELCLAFQQNNFTSDAAADNALDRILSVIGASKRFVLKPCRTYRNL